MSVTNIWNILNLRESPFFQDPLDPSTGGHYPVRLFVGRKREADHILRQTQAEHLRRIASHDVDASLTQAEAGRMLGLNATSTSSLFSDSQRRDTWSKPRPCRQGAVAARASSTC